jgi:hypothetical protein
MRKIQKIEISTNFIDFNGWTLRTPQLTPSITFLARFYSSIHKARYISKLILHETKRA